MDKRLNLIGFLLKALGVGQQSVQSVENQPKKPEPFIPPVKGQAQCLSCKKYKLGLTCNAYKQIPPQLFGNIGKCRYYSSKLPKVPEKPAAQAPAQAPAPAPAASVPPKV